VLLKHSYVGFIRQIQTKQNLLTKVTDSLFEQKLELATEGLEPHFLKTSEKQDLFEQCTSHIKIYLVDESRN
jgi:hypothetical protein